MSRSAWFACAAVSVLLVRAVSASPALCAGAAWFWAWALWLHPAARACVRRIRGAGRLRWSLAAAAAVLAVYAAAWAGALDRFAPRGWVARAQRESAERELVLQSIREGLRESADRHREKEVE